MIQSLTNASKFLSYILRHKPDAIGLTLDPEGWANIEELIAKADIPLTPALLHEVVADSDKKRFAISDDNLFIRANQGHSIAVNLGLEPVEPPELLYHGTASRFLESIRHRVKLPLCVILFTDKQLKLIFEPDTDVSGHEQRNDICRYICGHGGLSSLKPIVSRETAACV